MLHRATGPKTLSLSHQIAGRMRRTRNHAVSCWSTCHSRAPGFSFSSVNYILKIFKRVIKSSLSSPIQLGAISHQQFPDQESVSQKTGGYTCQRIRFQNVTMNCRCFLNAKAVAKVLGVSPSSGYELMHEPGFPVLRVGNRLVVPKEQFIQWVAEHTGGGCK